MQHGPLTPLTYPGSCKTHFFCIPVFGEKSFLIFLIIDLTIVSQGVRMIPWKVLGPGDDNSESINTLKVYCPLCTILHCNLIVIQNKPICTTWFYKVQ